MIGKHQSERSPLTSAEAMEVLEGRKKDGELGYEQKLAYDHIKKYSPLGAPDARKLLAEVMEYGVSRPVAVKIVDIMPMSITQLKHILAKEKKTFEEDEVNKIQEKVQSYRGK